MAGRVLTTLQLGSAASRALPLSALIGLGERIGAAAGPRLTPAKASQLARHLARVDPDQSADQLRDAVRRGYGSYGRYWVETFRLPFLAPRIVDRAFSVHGYGKVADVWQAGHGPILVLPHLGGWEWAAAWLRYVAGMQVSAVAERLEPAEVFDWFVSLRAAYGINVIPLGSGAMGELAAAVRRRDVVCLLADRDIGGTGIEVEFFGETTTLPAGPAVLARRTGAPLLPTAVYFRGRQRVGVVGDPIWPEGRGREEYRRLTQAVANGLEALVAQAPDQWHLLEPNWPSDRAPADPSHRAALAADGSPHHGR